MRPAGEVRQALLQAAADLTTPDRAPTLGELAEHAQVGYAHARWSVQNMARAGALRIVRTRRVAYRNRPVAEYVLVDRAQQGQGASAGHVALRAAVRAWGVAA